MDHLNDSLLVIERFYFGFGSSKIDSDIFVD
jgi:hypothetical protein